MTLPSFVFIVLLILLALTFRFDGITEKETTLAIIPDWDSADYVKKVILDSGFTILKEKTIQLDHAAAMKFYAEHSSRSFFSSLVKYITSRPREMLSLVPSHNFPLLFSRPVLVMVLEKENAIADWHTLIGPTDASKAKITHSPSVGDMCGSDIVEDCFHGSDSPQSARREIAFFFGEQPLVSRMRYADSSSTERRNFDFEF